MSASDSDSEKVVCVDTDTSDSECEAQIRKHNAKAAKAAKANKAKKPVAQKSQKVEAEFEESEDEDDNSASAASTSNSANKRHVRTPVERVDFIIKSLDKSGVTKKVVEELSKLRNQLDGAKIKKAAPAADAKRPPSDYNLFMREKMAELKDNGMKPKERFSECIRLWNEEKNKKKLVAAADSELPDDE